MGTCMYVCQIHIVPPNKMIFLSVGKTKLNLTIISIHKQELCTQTLESNHAGIIAKKITQESLRKNHAGIKLD